MAEAQAADNAPVKSGRRRTLVMGGLFLGVMLLEGATVFILARTFGNGPQDAAAATGGLDTADTTKAPSPVEVPVVSFRAQSERSQRMVVYDINVYAVVNEGEAEAFTNLVTAKKMTVQDRFSGLVRAADPQVFLEPDLATLREQFRTVLRELSGEAAEVRQVLIPSIVSYTDG